MKAIGLYMLLCLLSAPVTAQKLAPAAVPKTVSEIFIKDFPGIMAEWEISGGNYVATFEQNKYKMQTVYRPNGGRVETRVSIKEDELPPNARTFISSHNPATINEATKIIMADDKVNFKVLAGTQYMVFDNKGNFLPGVNK